MYNEKEYKRHRQKVLDYVSTLVQEPLVMFRQVCSSWGWDILTAAIQHPEDPHRYLVIGNFDHFPGWDGSSTEVDDWDALLGRVENWVQGMNQAATVTQVPETQPYSPRPKFGEPTVHWIRWIPENGSFSQPPGPQFAMRPPVPIAPQSAIEQHDALEHRSYLERELQKARKREEEAKEAAEEAQKWLSDIRSRVANLEKELGLK